MMVTRPVIDTTLELTGRRLPHKNTIPLFGDCIFDLAKGIQQAANKVVAVRLTE